MITRLSIVLFLITFALMLIPADTYACGKNHKKTEKSCAKKQSASKTEKSEKSLCKKEPCTGEHPRKDQGCGSNCNHSNCKCVHFTITIALTQENFLKETIGNFAARKHNSIEAENNVSAGFHSIWQPPKIS